MRYEFWISESSDVYYNLALEEYLVRYLNFSNLNLLLIYTNCPCAVLGKNQNILNEVNLKYCLDNQFKIARRISGGGTVVHDFGNINFSFFKSHQFQSVNKYNDSTGRISDFINYLGLQTILNERNAILLPNGKKISGSAQFSSNRTILSHFSLLYQSDIELIESVLKKNSYQIETRAGKSVRSEIDNLRNHLNLTQTEFIDSAIQYLGYTHRFNFMNIDSTILDKIYSHYKSIEYIYDKACTGKLAIDSLIIELQEGKIWKIDGIDQFKNYIGKRLDYSEIEAKDRIWKKLFNQ